MHIRKNNFLMKSMWVFLSSIISISLVFPIHLIAGDIQVVNATETADDEESECPFLEAEGRTIINIGERLRSNRPEAEGRHIAEVSGNLDAGMYDVFLASYDNHSDKTGQNQISEGWFLQLKNSSGVVVATTSSISDLPDDKDEINEQVDANFFVPENVSNLVAHHSLGFAAGNANSIEAVCAAFDLVNVDEEPESICGNKMVEEGEMCDDGNESSGDGCSNLCELEVLSCQDFLGKRGWYGEYFNYSRDHEDMNLDSALWPDDIHGDPLSADVSWDTDWYDETYFKFSRVDSDLSFGENFFPFDTAADEIDNGHDYHFGAHWSAKVTGTPGEYPFNLTSDDDVWVYVDGVLVKALPGVHPPKTATGTIEIVDTQIVDIFFAERHTVRSHMYFDIEGELEIIPFNDKCSPSLEICKLEDVLGNGPTEDDTPISGWAFALFDTGDPLDQVESGFLINTTHINEVGENGCVLFEDIEPGSYGVLEYRSENWVQTAIIVDEADAETKNLSVEFSELVGATTTPLNSFFDVYTEIDIKLGTKNNIDFYNFLPKYCGDGLVNQQWEQCDGGEECSEQCQLKEDNQCRDLVLARLNVDEVVNVGAGTLTENIYLGSLFNVIPNRTWFALYHNGSPITDPNISMYEDVSGLAVERQEGSVRTVLHGSLGSDDREHANGTLEFWNANVTGVSSDNSNGLGLSNKLERGFDGIKIFAPGQDEVSSTSTEPSTVHYWMTVNTADDGFITEWEIVDDCSGICGVKFHDRNQNGEIDLGEENISGWEIELLYSPINASSTPISSNFTTPNGYCFEDLEEGNYVVREVIESGWATTTPESVPISFTGEGKVTVNFGNIKYPSIRGVKFFDSNQNGLFDPGERGLGGWEIQLFEDPVTASSTPINTSVTDESGEYWFQNLNPGTYHVFELGRDGWVQTIPTDPENHTFSLKLGDEMTEANFGNFTATSSIHGIKYNDENANGKRDLEESGLADWTINLYNLTNGKNILLATTTTCGESALCSEEVELGSFWFEDVPLGVYSLSEEIKPNFVQTEPYLNESYLVLVGSHGADNSNPMELIAGPGATSELIQKYAVELVELSRAQQILLDFSGDGILNTTDARLVERAVNGEIEWSEIKALRNNGVNSHLILITEEDKLDGAYFGNTSIEVNEELKITNEGSHSISAKEATLTFDTNVLGTTRVVYGTSSTSTTGSSPLYGYINSTIEDSNLETSHSVTIISLHPGTKYFWRAISRKSTSSSEVIGSEQSFTTKEEEDENEDNGNGGSGGGGGTTQTSGGGGGGVGGIIPGLVTTQFGVGGGGGTFTRIIPSSVGPIAQIQESVITPAVVVRAAEEVGQEPINIPDDSVGGDEIGTTTEDIQGPGQLAGLSLLGFTYECDIWTSILALLVLLAIALYMYKKHSKKWEAVLTIIVGLIIFWILGSWSCSWLLAVVALLLIFLIGWDLRQRKAEKPPKDLDGKPFDFPGTNFPK